MADIDVTRRNKKPRLLLDKERANLQEFVDSIHYSARYVHPTVRNNERRRKIRRGRKQLMITVLKENFSCRYSDSEYEYRHVQLPKNMLKIIPPDYFDSSKGTLKLLWEDEWRGLGITQVCTGRSIIVFSDLLACYAHATSLESWLGTL